MLKSPSERFLLAFFLLGTFVVGASSSRAACDCTVLPTLGRAAEFPALGLENTDVELIGSVFAESTYVGPATDGNIANGVGGSSKLQGAAGINGFIFHHTGTSVSGGGSAVGGVVSGDTSGVVADARAASAAYRTMPATQTFGNITSNLTITGNGCINVINTGRIDIANNKELTIKGTADDYFIFNVNGKIEITGTAVILLDGLDPHQVLFNIVRAGEDVDLQGGGTADGTFLNIDGNIDIQGNAGGRGAYMGGGGLVKFQGNADFYGESFECGKVPVCPDPEASGVNIQIPATPTNRSQGNTSFYHAYYDTTNYEGHLESYRVTPAAVLKDKLDVDAIDSVTGLLESTRTPYWDAGVHLRTNTSRKIYTTQAGARVVLNSTNVSASDLDLTPGEIPSYPNHPTSGVTTEDDLRDAIIEYVYGEDAFFNAGTMRSAVLGDIFHSNALFVGSPTSRLAHEDGYAGFLNSYKQRDRVVYAGANDALLHAFDAGAWWDPSDPTKFNSGTGSELFGYLPGLLLPIAKLTPKTIDENNDRLIAGFVDGNTVAADAWLGDGTGTDITKTSAEWATVLMTAYREGGRGYLTLDVTDPSAMIAPHGPYPKLLWEFSNLRMGQSWSKPVIARVKLKAGTAGDHCGEDDGDGNCVERWVAIFGGGHEPDSDPNDANYFSDHTNVVTWSNRSKAIFMVALDTGAVISTVQFDSAVGSGTETMKYSIPSSPAVVDIDHDGFADLVYIGDSAGQMWKWDISPVGEDTDSDTLMDTWPFAVFFKSAPVVLGTGATHYRSLYAPAAVAYVDGVLTVAFGTGERRDTLFAGDVLKDENNRFYVIRDTSPTGWTTPLTPLTEATLTNITATATYTPPVGGDDGFYFIAPDGEKFFNDPLVFANHFVVASYGAPDPYPTCGSGTAYLYVFQAVNATGFFDTNGVVEVGDRKLKIGTGIPSSPRVTIASDPADDMIFITTSDGQVLTIEPPLRDPPESSLIYWRQLF